MRTREEYARVFDECKDLLREHGLIAPRVNLKVPFNAPLLSETNCTTTIKVGSWVQFLALFGNDRLRRTLLHELFHVLVDRVPPNWGIRGAFGDEEDWEAEQCFLDCFASNDEDYVTRYAMTHPEEDLVETAVFLLLEGEPAWNEAVQQKAEAVNEWFDVIRRRKRRVA